MVDSFKTDRIWPSAANPSETPSETVRKVCKTCKDNSKTVEEYWERCKKHKDHVHMAEENGKCLHELRQYLGSSPGSFRSDENDHASSFPAHLVEAFMLRELCDLANRFLKDDNPLIKDFLGSYTPEAVVAFVILISGWGIMHKEYPDIQTEIESLDNIYDNKLFLVRPVVSFMQGYYNEAEDIRSRYKPYCMPFTNYGICEVAAILYFYELKLLM